MRPGDPVKPSRWEVVGAWLGVWTPPIGAEIPPVPWRRLALAAVALAAIVVVVLMRTGESRLEQRERDARAAAEAAAARRERFRQEQRPVKRRISPATIAAVQDAVLSEAMARHVRGELAQRPRSVLCDPVPGTSAAGRRVVLDCGALTAVIRDGEGRAVGRLSFPFRAVLERPSGGLAICATNPAPGEQALPDPREVVQLPPACRR